MSTNPRDNRHYQSSPLPTLLDELRAQSQQDAQEILKMLYGEVCSSWRELMDTRFKLLGFVPSVSLAILIGLLSKDNPAAALSTIAKTVIALFGLLVTFALFVYERRNSQLYDDLISRGRKIEEELGVDTGQFRGRLKPSNKLIKHDVAINLIYGTALAGWIFAFLAIWLGW
ncbi:MAG: hypothetical protein ONB46_16490 [candidate division KSB1 bacterium]|nr:hypothetical protein [candidate division KSB1 bacterium]MDZ7367245.1 hypothetical protein [candidate division KSB1 bacterium]